MKKKRRKLQTLLCRFCLNISLYSNDLPCHCCTKFRCPVLYVSIRKGTLYADSHLRIMLKPGYIEFDVVCIRSAILQLMLTWRVNS